MSNELMGVVYAVGTRRIVRLVVPEDPADLNRQHLDVGEQMLRVPRALYQALGGVDALAAQFGLLSQ